jgi:tetratricopeptide (TPR) repeat protein
MLRVSKFAIALSLAVLTVSSASTASAAEEKPKKGKKAEGPAQLKVNLSKEFKAAYDPVVSAYLKSKDPVTAAASWAVMKAAIRSEDDKYQAGVFGMQIGREAKNDPMQRDAVELVLASTLTPADQRAAYTFQKAATAYDTKDWPTAQTWLIKAYDMGYRPTTIAGGVEMLIADSLNMQKKYPESLDWMQKSLDASKQPGALALPENFYPRAANVALKSGNGAVVSKWMRALVNSKPTADYWHDALMQTYKYSELDSQEVLDLMRLLRTVGGMKYEQNYSAYATDALIAFFPTEMKTVLEEGFAKGTISKTNATFGGRYNDVLEKLKIDGYSVTVLDQDIASAKTGAASAFAGDIALSVGEYGRAKGAYEAALAKGSIVDKDGKNLSERTIMRLGIAKLKLGDTAGAKAEFAKISSAGRKSVAEYWSLYAEHIEKGIAAKPS